MTNYWLRNERGDTLRLSEPQLVAALQSGALSPQAWVCVDGGAWAPIEGHPRLCAIAWGTPTKAAPSDFPIWLWLAAAIAVLTGSAIGALGFVLCLFPTSRTVGLWSLAVACWYVGLAVGVVRRKATAVDGLMVTHGLEAVTTLLGALSSGWPLLLLMPLPIGGIALLKLGEASLPKPLKPRSAWYAVGWGLLAGACHLFGAFLVARQSVGSPSIGEPVLVAPAHRNVATTPRAPTPTTVEPTTPEPASTESLTWAPLERPWTRIYLDVGCDEEAYGSMSVQPRWTGTVEASPMLSFRVESRDVDTTETEGPPEGEQTLYLVVDAGSQRVPPIATWGPNYVATCASSVAQVVYVGRRVDGRVLVSMEDLPRRAFGGPGETGRTRRLLLGWSDGVRELASWEGATTEVPDLFRIRPPSETP